MSGFCSFLIVLLTKQIPQINDFGWRTHIQNVSPLISHDLSKFWQILIIIGGNVQGMLKFDDYENEIDGSNIFSEILKFAFLFDTLSYLWSK